MKLNRVLMLSMSGDDVVFLQTNLKNIGFLKEKIDGYFGQNTLVAVTNFQRKMNIKADGIVGSLTWSKMINYGKPVESKVVLQKHEDITLKVSHIGENGFKIYDCLLSDDEYIKTETRKETIYLHHTAGGSRPDWTVGGWEKDVDDNGKSLKVATAYIIGRKSSSSNENVWDGKIIRTFDDRYWAYHLGIKRDNVELNSKSVGIEICNYGPLTKKGDVFYNYVNKPVSESDVVQLDKPFRGYKYYEKYTEYQIESLRMLLLYLSNRWGIEIEKGIYNEEWFEYNDKWFTNGGLRSHTQVRKDKFDVFPQPELIQMLNSL